MYSFSLARNHAFSHFCIFNHCISDEYCYSTTSQLHWSSFCSSYSNCSKKKLDMHFPDAHRLKTLSLAWNLCSCCNNDVSASWARSCFVSSAEQATSYCHFEWSANNSEYIVVSRPSSVGSFMHQGCTKPLSHFLTYSSIGWPVYFISAYVLCTVAFCCRWVSQCFAQAGTFTSAVGPLGNAWNVQKSICLGIVGLSSMSMQHLAYRRDHLLRPIPRRSAAIFVTRTSSLNHRFVLHVKPVSLSKSALSGKTSKLNCPLLFEPWEWAPPCQSSSRLLVNDNRGKCSPGIRPPCTVTMRNRKQWKVKQWKFAGSWTRILIEYLKEAIHYTSFTLHNDNVTSVFSNWLCRGSLVPT